MDQETKSSPTSPNLSQNLSDQVKRLSGAGSSTPLQKNRVYDSRIPLVTHATLVYATPATSTVAIAIRWSRPINPNIAHFELWVKYAGFGSSPPVLLSSSADSPYYGTLPKYGVSATAYIKTVMKNGLTSDLNNCPTVSFPG